MLASTCYCFTKQSHTGAITGSHMEPGAQRSKDITLSKHDVCLLLHMAVMYLLSCGLSWEQLCCLRPRF